ncbi:hypothetical protein L210DRAFT_3520165 [Boletus edulis BED1]|uniref:Uncharacterized protein n=1 Tax=Boletus edulis BED1 TaxID=1328754 RepID=A0AAD4GKN4_BOLED|nr:hypothetical protein L210DRAFT_3520165 [Boletus edulis BED1]
MLSRAPPKAYHLLLKTHKLTIFLTVHQSSTIAKVKEEALSALTSDVLASPSGVPHFPTVPGEDVDMVDENAQVPRIQSTEDFELCRAVKDKGKSNAASSVSTPVSYEILNPSTPVKGLLSNWEMLYVQFRDEDGNLLPVEVSQPSLLDEDDEEPRRAPLAQESPLAVSKGKRKAPPE